MVDDGMACTHTPTDWRTVVQWYRHQERLTIHAAIPRISIPLPPPLNLLPVLLALLILLSLKPLLVLRPVRAVPVLLDFPCSLVSRLELDEVVLAGMRGSEEVRSVGGRDELGWWMGGDRGEEAGEALADGVTGKGAPAVGVWKFEAIL
jgi:hypothetical protein